MTTAKTKAPRPAPETKAAETAAAKKPAPKAAVNPAKAVPETVAAVKKSVPKAVESEAKAVPEKPGRSKVVRDSFTFPESDYRKISELKKECLALGIHAKKSEILRAGLILLSALDKAGLKKTISQVEKIKTGRPLGTAKS